ncbi:MAG: lipopolysaccharide heptosyltransferase II [Pseudomonadota bacterium]
MDVRISAEESLSKAANIMIRSTNWIGDAVMTLPAFAAVRNSFPRAHITILAKPWVAELFELCPDIDEIILFQSPGIHDGLSGKWRIAREIRNKKFDAAILLQNAIEAAIITFLAGIPVRAGYNSDGRGLLLTHSVQRTKAIRKVHQTDYYLEMVKALGCRPADREFYLRCGQEHDLLGETVLKRHSLAENRLLVGMAPGAAYGPAKKWFPERFASVADKLVDAFSAQIVLFGSSGDSDTAAEVQAQAIHPMTDLTGKTGLKEAMALMTRCRLFISNDSGLMHVAAALGVPTVAVFGSTNPATTSPPGRKNIIIYKDVACSPCLKPDCSTDFKCMDLIGVDDVFGAAVRMLD